MVLWYQSMSSSSKATPSGRWIWGVGSVLLLPTVTDESLGCDQWGIKPTAAALKQTGLWTYGGLINHIESFVGDLKRNNLSALFVQPLLSYITKLKMTLGLNT